jgi:serine protease AprX
VARELRRLGVRYRAYWIVNAIAVAGDRRVVDALAALPDVASIQPDRAFRGSLGREGVVVAHAPTAAEWNLTRIDAPSLWSLGVTGQGIVYANADTGVTWDHPALKPHYRGWDGTTATHDYNWWDAIHADIDGNGTNPCGFSTRVPCDDTPPYHGTHTMGIAIGDDGAGNQIGVAPGAKWIACRNMDQGTGRPSTYIECLQFFLAPTDLNGQNPSPDRRPSIVGNSYACPPGEDCSVGALQAAVDAMRAAGVFMAVSAGNDGPACSSMVFPPAPYDSAVTVGSTNIDDVIAQSSSRGPVTADGSGRSKPDLVAPGVNVRSSVHDGYAALSGTSMASPHVGGAVALLWSAFPDLRGNVDRTEQLLEQSAAPLTTTVGCGGDSATQVPNNVYGYGRIDVFAAYRAAEAAEPPALAVADASVSEGTGGTKPLTFTVTLARPSTRPVTVAYTTVDGSAKAGSDFTAASGTLSFAPGEREQRLTVAIGGDAVVEPRETFTVHLDSPTNATLGRADATGTIEDDDVDRTAPRVTRLSVAGRTVRLVLSERATVSFSVKRGSRVVARFSRSLGTGSVALRLPVRLAPGSYVLAAVARDAAGNVSRPTTVRLHVKT